METKTAVLNGKSDAGNPHVRLDGGGVASYPPTAGRPERGTTRGANPRRGSLLYKNLIIAAILIGWALPDIKAKDIPNVIFDSDMVEDYDDVGALAALHALADDGRCEILATLTCTRGNQSVATVEVVNAFYGREDIPVGCAKGIGIEGTTKGRTDMSAHGKFTRIAKDYARYVRHANSDDAPDANTVYRKVLSVASDKGVTVCSVGFLTNLRRLLETKPDSISPLSGLELVAKKVKALYVMAGYYPRGREYNIEWDIPSAQVVFGRWPTPIFISDFNLGRSIYSGRKVSESEYEYSNPVKDIYARSLPSRAATHDSHCWDKEEGGHSSWDPVTVLASVFGSEPYFIVRHGYFTIDQSGANTWHADPSKAGGVLECAASCGHSRQSIGALLDDLIARRPRSAWGTQRRHTPSSAARVMCLGDSITHFGYCEYYLQLFENLRHPGSAVRYVNAGYSGGTVGTGLNRLPIETDRIRPDRAFVMFGMNDVRWTDYVTNAVMSAERRQAADKALATYRADLPKLVDRILASGVRDLTLVTPTPYDEYSTVLGPRRKFVNEYGLSLAAESVRRLAAEKGLKVVDLHAALTDACRANPGKKLCGCDSVHPGKTGHLLMASVYWRTLGCDRPVAAVTLDASGSVIRAENAEVSDVSATVDALAFDYTPGALPFPDCPEYREVKAINPDFARFNREPLVVVGLKAGDWELVVDGRRLGIFSADVLSRGVNLAELDTPNRRQAAKAMEAAYKLHDFDVPRRDVACVRSSFEKFGVDMNDRDALAKCSKKRLAKLKVENYRWYDWEKAASEKFLASVGREAEIAAEEDRLYAAIAAPRPVTCRVEIRRTVKLSASGESTLTAYIPKGIDITAAVVICPGGGYTTLCDTYEGVDMARWLVERGVAAFVLRYRLAPKYHGKEMLEDVREALRYVREHAEELNVDPHRVGVLGFSAGGHLACLAGTTDADWRADFMALVYAHISMAKDIGHGHMREKFLGAGATDEDIRQASGELLVDGRTPPAFLVHARTDEVCSVEHSRRFAAAMREKGRPVDYLELESGRHGLGCGRGEHWHKWLDAFEKWLREMGATAAALEQLANACPRIIFDTDMYTDYDDIGALAILHALADRGECELIAMGSNTGGKSAWHLW